MFNVPVVDLTAQAATEQRKTVSEVSDLLAQFGTDPKPAAGKNTMLTAIQGECVFSWSHKSKRSTIFWQCTMV